MAELARVFAEFERPVRAFCRRYLEAQDAEDAAQETFLKILRSIGQYDATRPLRSWVFKIAARTCIDLLRRRRPELFADMGDEAASADRPEDRLIRREDAERVRAALESMPPVLRMPLELLHVEGLDPEEIEDVLDITRTNLRIRLFRARQWLRKALVSKGSENDRLFRSSRKT